MTIFIVVVIIVVVGVIIITVIIIIIIFTVIIIILSVCRLFRTISSGMIIPIAVSQISHLIG